MKYLFIMLLFISLSCNRDHNSCSNNLKDWVKEAPAALDEFLLVKQEILSNKSFIDSISVKDLLFVYTNSVDSTCLEYFNMPLLRKWFKKGRGSILFRNGDTSACFKQCFDESRGKLHFGPFDRSRYNSSVKIIDTLKLKDNWYAEVSKCPDCGS